MAKEMTAAERVMAAYAGRTKSAARQAAGKKGATKAAWKRTVGSKVNWNTGNPYWDLSKSAWPKAKAGVNPWTTAVKSKLGRGATTSAEKAVKSTGLMGGLKSLGKNPTVQGLAIGMILASLANKMGDAFIRGPREEELAMAELGSMERIATPEAAYLQATLPYNQAQEREMAAALLGRLGGGGVLGPSLAQGEYSIGG